MKKKLLTTSLVFLLMMSCVLVFACKKVEPESLVISKQPSKLSYYQGDEIDLGGGEFCIKYSDGSIGEKIAMTNNKVSNNFDKTKLGEQVVTITYEKLSATITVTVSELTEEVRQSRLVARLVDGLIGATPSGLSALSDKIQASYDLLKGLSQDDDAFLDIVSLALEVEPNYINTLSEYFFTKEETAKVKFLEDLLDSSTAGTLANIQSNAASISQFDSQSNGDGVILSYYRLNSLLQQIQDKGYSFLTAKAQSLAAGTQTIYQKYHFSALDDKEYFGAYINYLAVAELDTNEEYLLGAAFKERMETFLDTYYGLSFDNQYLLKQSKQHFSKYFEGYFETYVGFDTALTSQVLDAREDFEYAIENELTEDGYYESLSSFAGDFQNIIYQYNNLRSGTQYINRYVVKEIEAIRNSAHYKLATLMRIANTLVDDYNRWNDYYREYYEEYGIYPPDEVVRGYALIYVKSAELLTENAGSQKIMELYNDRAKQTIEQIMPIAKTIFDAYAADLGDELIYKSSVTYYDYYQYTDGLSSYSNASYEYLASIATDIEEIIKSFWLVINEPYNDEINVGQRYFDSVKTISLIQDYAGYYVLKDRSDLFEYFVEWKDLCFMPADTNNRYTFAFLTNAYFLIRDYEALPEGDKQLFGLGLDGEGLIGYIRPLFEDNNTLDVWLFDAGYEFYLLNISEMSVRLGDKARFVRAYLEMLEKFEDYTPQEIELINQTWLDSDGFAKLDYYRGVYEDFVHPFFAIDQSLAITEQDLLDFTEAFEALVVLMDEYNKDASEYVSYIHDGQAVPNSVLERLSQGATLFTEVLHALPYRIQEVLVSHSIDRNSLFGDLYKSLIFIDAYYRFGSNQAQYELARSIISHEDTFISYMAEAERIEALDENPLTNAFWQRQYETFTLQDIAQKYNNLTQSQKNSFDATPFGAILALQKAAFDSATPYPSELFDELIHTFREFSKSYEEAYLTGDMTFFFAMRSILEDFLVEFHNSASENDEIMFDNSIIMISFTEPVGYYGNYLQSNSMWVLSDTPSNMYNNLFVDILIADRWQEAHFYKELSQETFDGYVQDYLEVVKIFMINPDDFYALTEQQILGLMQGLRDLNPLQAKAFLNVFTSYSEMALNYYGDFDAKELHILTNLLAAEQASLIYKAEYQKWQNLLADTSMPSYVADNHYTYTFIPALNRFMAKAFIAYNVYDEIDSSKQVGIIKDLYDMHMSEAIALAAEGLEQEFSIDLYNVGVLLINAKMAMNNSSWSDFAIAIKLAERGIAALSSADKQLFQTAIYIPEYEQYGNTIPGQTLEEMYQEIEQSLQERLSWQIEESRALFVSYYEAVWLNWQLALLDDTSVVMDAIEATLDDLVAYGKAISSDEFKYFLIDYCGGVELSEMLIGYTYSTFDYDSMMFGSAYMMFEALSKLFEYSESEFVGMMKTSMAIYGNMTATERNEFRAVFGELYDIIAAVYDLIAPGYL